MNKATIFFPETESEFWQTALDDVVLSIKETLRDFDECRLGLAGGSTPKKLYEALAKQNLPWEKIKIIILDERQVPSDSPHSNLGMIREALLKKISIPPENILSFDTSLPAESSAKEMSRKLVAVSHKRFPLFDLLILGAGTDGHIASLFEGDKALNCNKYASPAKALGYDIEDRLTVCLLGLKSTRQALLLLKGEAKQQVVQALKGEPSELKLTALKEVIESTPVKVLAYLK